MSKKLLMLAGICLSASLVACDALPPMPDIEVSLVDQRNAKIHYYMLPKKTGESAQHLRSVPLTLPPINKNFCIDPANYSKLEVYMSTVEDYARERCK